jgi:dTMP kinase
VLTQLEHWVHGDLQPDLTIWFDLPAAMAAERRAAAREPDRFEQQAVAFFERVRSGYQARMNAAPQRIVRIDSSLAKDAVSKQIINALEARQW